jgi:hypothetical protein
MLKKALSFHITHYGIESDNTADKFIISTQWSSNSRCISGRLLCVCGTKINSYVQKPDKKFRGVTVTNVSKCVTPLSQDNIRSLTDEWTKLG